MKSFSEDQFMELAGRTGEIVISIYTPTRRQSTDSYQIDKTNFKNTIKEIGRDLQSVHKLEEEHIKRLIKPAQDLLEDLEFWQNNDKMLAFFLFDGEAEFFQLPLPIEQPLYLISRRPYLLPLMPQLNNDQDFYLLHLDTERIRLYEGSRFDFKEMELDGNEIPLSYAEEEEANDEFQGVRKRQGSLGSGGDFAAHGEGPGEERKQLVQNYIHNLANKLDKKLNQNARPLFLAGLDYLIPMFRQASKYPLLQKSHLGTLDRMGQNDIHKKALELASDHFKQEENKRKEEYGFKASRKLAVSDDKETLIKAAITGGVDTFWVNKNHQQRLWGEFNADDFTLRFDKGPTGKNHCLIDVAAAKVLDNGGKVYLVPPEEMPTEALIAGTLRYEVNAVE